MHDMKWTKTMLPVVFEEFQKKSHPMLFLKSEEFSNKFE